MKGILTIGRLDPENVHTINTCPLLLGLGILGLLLWLMGHAVALTTRQAWPGLLVLVLSCWTEDTLETQAGVTLALWVLAFPVLPAGVGSGKGLLRRSKDRLHR